MDKTIFKGCATALITPFDENRVIDFDTLGVLLERQIAAGIDAIVMCGTTGECATISDLEFDRIISFCAQRIGKRVPLVAGVGKNDTAHATSLAASAYRLGADALLAVTPYYNKTSQQGLAAHFFAIAEGGGLPLIVYNVPSRTGMTIEADTYAALAAHPLIAGTKEASGDIAMALEIRARCPEGFCLYSGNDDSILPMLAIGGHGAISTAANIVPRAVGDICRRWFAGDLQQAQALQTGILPLVKALFCDVNPIPVKAALQMMGYDSGALRLPLVPLADEKKELLKSALDSLELL